MNEVLDPLLHCRTDDIANARDVGLDERLGRVAQIDGHDRGAVNDAITPPKGGANGCDVADVPLDDFERTLGPLEYPPGLIRTPCECPYLVPVVKKSANRMGSS